MAQFYQILFDPANTEFYGPRNSLIYARLYLHGKQNFLVYFIRAFVIYYIHIMLILCRKYFRSICKIIGFRNSIKMAANNDQLLLHLVK